MVISYIVLAVFAFALTALIMWIHKCVSQFCKKVFIRYRNDSFAILCVSNFSFNLDTNWSGTFLSDWKEENSVQTMQTKIALFAGMITRRETR